MHVRWIPTLFFAAAATPAFAQSPNVLTAKPENDVVFARKLYELGQTDMAESLCTLLEAGGKLTDLAGKPLDYRAEDPQVNAGIIASNGVVHAGILHRLG